MIERERIAASVGNKFGYAPSLFLHSQQNTNTVQQQHKAAPTDKTAVAASPNGPVYITGPKHHLYTMKVTNNEYFNGRRKQTERVDGQVDYPQALYDMMLIIL